jgi:uncharacterized membrane protein YfcA
MVGSSFSMIFDKRKDNQTNDETCRPVLFMLQGAGIGVLAGIVGAGGGFLIIPSLVILARIPIKKAIGTSLLMITVNSFIGFSGDLKSGVIVDWHFLLRFTLLAISGIILGSGLNRKLDSARLKPAFGYFVLAMGLYIILKELL